LIIDGVVGRLTIALFRRRYAKQMASALEARTRKPLTLAGRFSQTRRQAPLRRPGR
jgi:hypothetical protein